MAKTDADQHRQTVLDAIGSPNSESTKLLLNALQDEDPLVREWAVEGLLQRKEASEQAIQALIECLQRDERADLRWYAARALGKLGISTEPVKTSLITALRDRDLYVRCFAAWAIGELRIADMEAVAALRERLLHLRAQKTSLEAQSVGVALARIHTESNASERQPEPQLSLFEYAEGRSELPSTKQQLVDYLCRTAEAIVEDRTGIRLNLRRQVSIAARLVRDHTVKEQVVSQRGPNCQICNDTFHKRNGLYYYECHHIVPLSLGGPDDDWNLLVLCANHHRQLHYAAIDWPAGEPKRPPAVLINGERYPIRWTY